MTLVYFCCDERRRDAVKASAALNGIDFLEVSADQLTLLVHFVKPISAPLARANVRIEGGERVRDPDVVDAQPAGKILTVTVAEYGDFSPYTLRLVADQHSDAPPPGIDPVLAAIDFSFKVGCESDYDCKDERVCPPEVAPAPEIDYLAKDYASFRQLMLDRLAVLVPSWRERSPADLGIALVELLAYVGDQLSYHQDAAATEAYLSTARRRVSVRRHARLVDYVMHDGCNARVWVQVLLGQGIPGPLVLPAGTPLLTALPGVLEVVPTAEYARALGQRPEVFETMHDGRLVGAHRQLPIYTWGSRECCLPRGSTSATLRGAFPELREGDVVVLAELRGAETGAEADADPQRRHAVRLTRVRASQDPLGGRFHVPPTDTAVAITEVEWADEDALPFALCISARTEAGYVEGVSCMLGNIVLAEHGRRVNGETSSPWEELPAVPEPTIFAPPPAGERCEKRPHEPLPPRYRPTLFERPLTHHALFDPEHPPASAAAAMRWSPADAEAWIELAGSDGTEWAPLLDLLTAGPATAAFVPELETDGTTSLRFGDDRYGQRPTPGTTFRAFYRVGNGTAGNIGARAIAHVVTDVQGIAGASNPLPAAGGVDPESAEDARQQAPAAFNTQERAVTAEDYGEVSIRRADVQRANATLRWTGSWRTMFVTVDRTGGLLVDEDFRGDMLTYLDRYRMAGQDVEVDAPRFVPIELALFVCLRPGVDRSAVERSLRDLFSNRTLPDGRRGLFHPDDLTFGQPLYLSAIYAAAHGVAGVASVDVKRFRRQNQPLSEALDSGILTLDRLEIARLDQDPDYPEHGKLELAFGGGR